MRHFLLLGLTFLCAACAEIPTQDTARTADIDAQAVSSYQILPTYPQDLVDCLKKCQRDNASLTDVGLDDLRKCGCDCHARFGGTPNVKERFCESGSGLMPGYDRDTLDDFIPKRTD